MPTCPGAQPDELKNKKVKVRAVAMYQKVNIMSYGNISAVLSNANKQNIKDSVADILALLPFLVNLTTEERRSLQMIGKKKRFAFVQKVVQHTNDNPQVIPPNF